jgi:hypothetical protein
VPSSLAVATVLPSGLNTTAPAWSIPNPWLFHDWLKVTAPARSAAISLALKATAVMALV